MGHRGGAVGKNDHCGAVVFCWWKEQKPGPQKGPSLMGMQTNHLCDRREGGELGIDATVPGGGRSGDKRVTGFSSGCFCFLRAVRLKGPNQD